PCNASTLPNRFARLSTTIAASVMERAILPTTSTPPPSHPSPTFGFEPVRPAAPPLAQVVGPFHITWRPRSGPELIETQEPFLGRSREARIGAPGSARLNCRRSQT